MAADDTTGMLPWSYTRPYVTISHESDPARRRSASFACLQDDWLPRQGGDADTRTDHLKAGAYLEKKLKGYTVPTFKDLLRGLTSLPHGEDARALTQCLVWYDGVRKSFTPNLELNVLHTQALFRCLRCPLEPISSSNLNRLALEQLHERGVLQKIDVEALRVSNQREARQADKPEDFSRTRAVFDIRSGPVELKLCVKIPIRHILIFPFLALHGVVADAYEMGISKAQQRRNVRKHPATPVKPAPEVKIEPGDISYRSPKGSHSEDAEEGLFKSQVQTPKRSRVLSDVAKPEVLRTPKRPTVSPITPRASSTRLPTSKRGIASIKWEKDASQSDSVYSRR